MKNTISRFWANEDGQDLIEYTLLLAFVVLASASLMNSGGKSIHTIWTAAGTTLANAAVAAS
jgi:Flp pilus assembly pilin Flp